MKVIGSTTSPYVRKVRVVLAEKKIDYDLELDSPWAADTRVPQSNPLGKVPVLILEDGRKLYDSRVIVEFLDNVSPVNRLIPAENREKTEVKRWEALADGILDAGIFARLESQRPDGEKSPSTIERQLSKVNAGLAAMANDLGDRPWCCGIDLTLADIAVGCCVGWLDFRFPQLEVGTRHANLGRLSKRLTERASFAATTPKE
jgi:glutathione S-transferase